MFSPLPTTTLPTRVIASEVLSDEPCCSKTLPVQANTTNDEEIEKEQEDDMTNEQEITETELSNFFDVDIAETGLTENDESRNKRRDARNNIIWEEPVGNHNIFEYTSSGGLHENYAAELVTDLSPYKCFRTLVDDEIINEMVDQTNLYATQSVTSAGDISKESRLHKWVPTDKTEMIKFIGIAAYMGLVKMPRIEKYWSNDVLYSNSLIPSIMSRNRFQLLLKMWHFSDNTSCPEGDRLHKISPLLEKLLTNFQAVYTPGRTFCIDESVIPFQGRLVFKQYIPQKTHKYGVKLFKLCSGNGFTWNIRIYAGKERNEGNASVPTNIVLNLSRELLNSGRTIVADNYYTSLELANLLLDEKTHYIGTLRANRRGNPREVLDKKLKRGEVYGQENERGICILKWRDKRDVLLLSTKHNTDTVEIQRRSGVVKKPKAIIDYNEAKSSIDQSDQMASYNSPLRKSLKWYRKLALEFILGTALVNAHIIYNQLAPKMKITEFREEIIKELIKGEPNNRINVETPRKSLNHSLLKKDGPFDKVRKYCKGCYGKKMRGEITKNRVKKVVTYCNICETQPHFCLNCFNAAHAKL